jgi:hypothetical protein
VTIASELEKAVVRVWAMNWMARAMVRRDVILARSDDQNELEWLATGHPSSEETRQSLPLMSLVGNLDSAPTERVKAVARAGIGEAPAVSNSRAGADDSSTRVEPAVGQSW